MLLTHAMFKVYVLGFYLLQAEIKQDRLKTTLAEISDSSFN